jgi:hypothetical protein
MIRVEDLEPPASLAEFEDVYIISELMETDLHRIIYSRQELSDDHIQYFIYQVCLCVRPWIRATLRWDVRISQSTWSDLVCAEVLAFRQRYPPGPETVQHLAECGLFVESVRLRPGPVRIVSPVGLC